MRNRLGLSQSVTVAPRRVLRPRSARHPDTRQVSCRQRGWSVLGWLLFGLVAGATPRASVVAEEPPLSPDETRALEFFESQVRPLLVNRCFTCHSADTNSHGGLRVDDRQGLLTGGGRGPAVVPGAPAQSLLLRAVKRTDDKLKMPPEKPLEEAEVQILERWIAAGAPMSSGERP